MNIKLSVEDRAKLQTLLKQKSYNIEIASLFNNLCLYNDEYLMDYLKENVDSLDDTFLFQTVLNLIDVDDIKMVRPYLEHSFHVEDINKYLENPYVKQIKPFNDHNQDVKLTSLKYEPYTFFPLDEIRIEDNYREISSLGLFTKEYPYLALVDKEGIWMCITPNEINTMQPYIDKAKGHVVTFGLGLGYFAFMASLKEEVNKVTIIEYDDKVIDIFNKHLLNQFPYKEKIEIIKSDAIEFVKNTEISKYDFIYFDLWHNPNDGLPLYIELKKLEKKKSYYWLEESLIALVRRYTLTLIEEQLKGFKEEAYTSINNDDDKIISLLYYVTKDKQITTFEEINDLLTNQSLLSLIK